MWLVGSQGRSPSTTAPLRSIKDLSAVFIVGSLGHGADMNVSTCISVLVYTYPCIQYKYVYKYIYIHARMHMYTCMVSPPIDLGFCLLSVRSARKPAKVLYYPKVFGLQPRKLVHGAGRYSTSAVWDYFHGIFARQPARVLYCPHEWQTMAGGCEAGTCTHMYTYIIVDS